MIKIPQSKPKSNLKAKALRLVSKRYEKRAAIADAIAEEPKPIRRVFGDCMMTKDKKLLFLRNHKAGCTSVSQMIVHYSTGEYSDAVHKHRNGVYFGERDYFEIRQGFDSKSTYCFSMVRNPLKRLVSAYINIFVDKDNGAYLTNLDAIIARGYKVDGEISANFEIFVDFVEEALADTNIYCDRHWREQHINIGNAYLPYDFIAKIENYNDDIRHVFNAAGMGDYISTIDQNKRYNPSSRMDISVSTALKTKIEKIYAKDYELFGY